jgi:hypothetical protein
MRRLRCICGLSRPSDLHLHSGCRVRWVAMCDSFGAVQCSLPARTEATLADCPAFPLVSQASIAGFSPMGRIEYFCGYDQTAGWQAVQEGFLSAETGRQS